MPILFKLLISAFAGFFFLAAPFYATASQSDASLTARATAPGRSYSFAMPAELLRSAIVDFANATALPITIDDELLGALQSNPLLGDFTAEEGLKALVKGTGLEVAAIGPGAYTLHPAPSHPLALPPGHLPALFTDFAADVQNGITSALCRDQSTIPIDYTAALELRLDKNGHVSAVGLEQSTGDAFRDAEISKVLTGAMLTAPPPDLPQPIHITVMPRHNSPASACTQPLNSNSNL